MAKNMSFKSISFNRVSKDFEAQSDRFKKECGFLPVRSNKEEKETQLTYLRDNSAGLQAVFRAEIVKILTLDEIKNHLNNLKILLENAEDEKIFKISCHPQSDAMTKSSHFHLWGDITPAMEKAFEEYLINNRLTVQNKVNITAVNRGELRKVELNADGNEEFKKVTFQKNTGHYKVDYKKDEIKTNNASESVVLSTIEIIEDKKEVYEIDADFKKELLKNTKIIDSEIKDEELTSFFNELDKSIKELTLTLTDFNNYETDFEARFEKIKYKE